MHDYYHQQLHEGQQSASITDTLDKIDAESNK